MVNEQQAAGLGTSDYPNGNSAAGVDLDSELIFVEGILLPFGLVGAFAVTDGDESPVIWEEGELL
jgi:hypothetical protein